MEINIERKPILIEIVKRDVNSIRELIPTNLHLRSQQLNASEQLKSDNRGKNRKNENQTENDVQFQIIIDFQLLLATSRRIGYVEL